MHDFYEIIFISIGHGDATLIRNKNNQQTALIDAGKAKPVLSVFRESDDLKAIFITHWDKDHYYGMPSILKSLLSQCKKNIKVYINRQYPRSRAALRFRRTLAEAKENGTIIIDHAYANDPQINMLGGRFIILWPEHDTGILNTQTNIDSIVVRFNVAELGILFGGDAIGSAWSQIPPNELKALILRFPHHGGNLSNGPNSRTCEELISDVDPLFIIISARKHDPNHPSAEFKNAMKNHPDRHFLFTAEGNVNMHVERKADNKLNITVN
jgi:beta-lactamase superfamily II metal-dependent hydrolase